MNLRQIETFLSVAESGSFRRAAELLHRSQSVVSVHVRQIEDELGVPLLERTTRRVSLTNQGQTFLIRCKSVLADLHEVAHDLKEEANLRRGRVSIGSAPSISTHRLPPVLAQYLALYPGVSVELHEAFAKGMYNDVLQRITDFAVGPRLDSLKDFDHHPIIQDPIVVVLPGTFELGPSNYVTLEKISQQPQLTMPEGTAIREVIEKTFRERHLTFSPKFEVMHQQTLFSLVKAGLGIAILPLMSVPPKRSDNFQVALLREPSITREICLVSLKGKTLSPAATRCAEMIIQELQNQFKEESLHSG